jgi:demethylmenaquinone methyltransferase/2-methoxy-6-polyprenyl-1,4-benzoquinol methylase
MNDREHVVATYRKSAARYDLTSRLNLALGPQRAHRRRAVRALGLRPGDTVVELGCGTGLNFPLIEREIGPGGQIIGVDLTDAMLAQARHRIEANGWSNVSLVHADAGEFEFPAGIDAILATYAHSLLPAPRQVIAKGTAALSTGGRMAVLDVKVPAAVPRWLTRRRDGVEAWAVRRPWEEIRAAMQDTLVDVSWTELFFGSAYLAVGQSPQNRAESA